MRKSEHVHLAHVPRRQRRRRWGARSAPWREIEFSNSRVKYHSIHLSTIFMLGLISLRFYLFWAETIEYTRIVYMNCEWLFRTFFSSFKQQLLKRNQYYISLYFFSGLVPFQVNPPLFVNAINIIIFLMCRHRFQQRGYYSGKQWGYGALYSLYSCGTPF